jgi:pyruvate dehydrogenase E1 component beta subunit
MGAARVAREGEQVTLLTWGGMTGVALDAAEAAADDMGADEGVSIEVIDLRSLSPVDYDTIAASVRRTGRVVIAQEGPREAGLASEIAAVVTERCFAFLEHAPVRVTGHDVPYPPAKLEKHHLPDLDRVLYGVDQVLGRISTGSISGVNA